MLGNLRSQKCIRNCILNIYYLHESEKMYIKNNSCEIRLQILDGYNPDLRKSYKYSCIWKKRFPLIPYKYTLEYIQNLMEVKKR